MDAIMSSQRSFRAFPLIIRKMRRFARFSRLEKIWLLPVWLLLGMSRFLILFVPFRCLAARLGAPGNLAPWVPLLEARDEAVALSIGRVVRTAARYTPWQSDCFPQAVVARILLGFHGVPYVLFLGVNRDAVGAKMTAHAWVAAGRVRVTGGGSFGRFAVVGCFVSKRHSFSG